MQVRIRFVQMCRKETVSLHFSGVEAVVDLALAQVLEQVDEQLHAVLAAQTQVQADHAPGVNDDTFPDMPHQYRRRTPPLVLPVLLIEEVTVNPFPHLRADTLVGEPGDDYRPAVLFGDN